MCFSDYEGETKGVSLAGASEAEEAVVKDADILFHSVLFFFFFSNSVIISYHLAKNTTFFLNFWYTLKELTLLLTTLVSVKQIKLLVQVSWWQCPHTNYVWQICLTTFSPVTTTERKLWFRKGFCHDHLEKSFLLTSQTQPSCSHFSFVGSWLG